ncbi:hypothetical protein V474_25335 [Novosphingobium barchaimii LL02]|uniref:Uncharacterized protein n=1 Tax=Novosphingobium barchaimii LL02 TaxID=1114963 RepID=A0A0J7XMF0_9SPHN|nr:hypothetical protein [Novosphingobium barchaimii]KMS52867.1 hypothetical protein V474_25335 [Novosphingobium barchaimii LL02]
MTRLLISAVCGAALALTAAPAFAQQSVPVDAGAGNSDEKVNQLIIYGQDACPPSSDSELVICVRKGEGERFRIPEPLRGIDSPKSEAWANKVQAYETVGAFGTLSCSPVGAGGSLGCTQQLIDRASAERKNGSEVRFGELIAAERQKRLSTIDEDAAAQQARVEEAEKAYFDQRQRQEAAEDAALGQATTPPKPK